jgi:hypothetical protein
MNPTLIDLASLIKSLPAKLDKDERRMRLFVAAVSNKSVLLSAAANPTAVYTAFNFAQESGILIAAWALRAKKFSFADLFRDPYKDLREQTRAFGARWDLDPLFRSEMG